MPDDDEIIHRRADTGNEPKKYSKDLNSAKYHSRSAEYKKKEK